MGKGDKKTRRGKIWIRTYGVRRPRKKRKKSTAFAVPSARVKVPKKAETVVEEVLVNAEAAEQVTVTPPVPESPAAEEKETITAEEKQEVPVGEVQEEQKPEEKPKKTKKTAAKGESEKETKVKEPKKKAEPKEKTPKKKEGEEKPEGAKKATKKTTKKE